MLPKGTPSKTQCAQRVAEFQKTPGPLPRRSLFGGSPMLWESGTPYLGSPVAALPLTPAPQGPLPQWTSSPPMPVRLQGGSPISLGRLSLSGPGSPLGGSYRRSAAAPPGAGQPAMPFFYGCLSPNNRSPGSSGSSSHAFQVGCHGLIPLAGSSGGCSMASTSLSTPSKIISVSTPLRPCSRQRAKEMQDDLKTALDEQSAPLLRVALQRRHACAGEHALHEAVRQAHAPAVRLLLQSKANPNARCLALEAGCEFPLQLAVCSSAFLSEADRCQVVELLLQAGAWPSIGRGDAEANTPLHDAARRGNLGAAMLLLKRGADPNVANGYGEGPLQIALRSGGVGFMYPSATRGMVEALLKAGASPLAVDSAGPCGLSVFLQISDPELREMLRVWSCWWRCRMLAWIRSKGSDHPLCQLVPELLMQVSRFL